MNNAHIKLSAKAFSFKLLEGLEKRLDLFRADMMYGYNKDLHTPEEWLEIYKEWAKNNQETDLNSLIKNYLREQV